MEGAIPPASHVQQPLPLEQPQRLELGEGCVLQWHPGLFANEHEQLIQALRAELPWSQELYRRGDHWVPAPRLTSFHGDPDCSYSYSGIAYTPAPFGETLLRLRGLLRAALGQDFNSVLANLYRDGRDSLGFHADDEPELGPHPHDVVIASLSLGAARRFVLKHRRQPRKLCYELGGGSLLVMRGRTQQHWVHALPKTRRPSGPRLNLTFRVIVAPRAGAGVPG